MQEAIKTFIKGMNTDLDISMVNQGMYKYAKNIRLGNYDASSDNNVGALENVIGNTIISGNPLTEGTVVGQTNIRDYIVLFVIHSTYDAIYSLKLNSDGNAISEFNTVYTDENSTSKLNFSTEGELISIGRQETEGILKVYWADGINPIRYIDITEDNSSSEVSSLEVVPPYILSYPYASRVIDGGEYKAGVVQYSYQLYNKNGASTTFSPLSNMVKISAIPESEEGGSEKDEIADKSIEVLLNYDSYDSRFDRIRIVAIHYSSINGLPHVRVIKEMPNSEDIRVIDTGNYINEMTVEEFNSFAETDYIPTSIESKNNYLFASNILEEAFDNQALDNWDSRAYRFIGSGSTGSVTLSDLIVVTDNYVIFTKTVVFRETPLTGIDGTSPWEDFWFYDNNKIYIVVPADFDPNTTAFSTDTEVTRTAEVQDVYSYDDVNNLLSFSGREIKSYEDVVVDSGFDFPVDWDKTAWNSGSGSVSGAVAKVYTNTGVSLIITETDRTEDPINWSVPITHDAINYYNKLKPTSEEMYAFQTDEVTYGGEGPNIKYWFETVANLSGGIENNHLEPTKIGIEKQEGLYNYVACQPDEVYRTAIGFYNSKGQVSFVKWIGDIKTPSFLSETLYAPMTSSDNSRGFSKIDAADENKLRSYGLIIRFELTSLPSDDDIQGWQIFRVERAESDRSILYSGMISPVAFNYFSDSAFGGDGAYRPHSKLVSGEYYPMIPLDASVSGALFINDATGQVPYHEFQLDSNTDRIVEFISPEINFYKPEIEISNLELKVDKIIKRSNSHYIDTSSGNTSVSFTKFGNTYPLQDDYNSPTTDVNVYYSINEYKYVNPVHENATRSVTINGSRYINQIYFVDDGADNYGGRGSGVILGLNEGLYNKLRSLTTGYDTLSEYYVYGSLVRDVFLSRYGGSSYYDRLSNEYIPFSTCQSIDNLNNGAIYGDVYISMFQFMRGLWWDTVSDTRQSLQESIAFPVESSINLRYRLDNIQRYINDGTSWKVRGMILETMTPQETVEKGIELQPETYDPEIGDLYRYNSVYSVNPAVKKYYPKPFDFEQESRNDVKVIVSEKKFNGEYEDKWTVFKPANFIEVDTAYGSVNVLKSFRDRLWFWQDKAFGVLSVNERSVIQDNNPGQLAIGTSGVLQRYDYLVTSIGAILNKNVSVSDSAIYWYDKINHQLVEYSDRIKYLDTEKGIRSYILDKEPSDNVIVEIDTKNREVAFAFPDDNVLIYNQANQVFVSEYSYTPYKLFKDFNENLISIPVNSKYELYNHNTGNRGEFYGNTDYSEIDILVNDNYGAVKVFDNIEFPSRVLQGTINIFDDTFDKLKTYNSYQNTGEYDLVKDGTYSDTVLPLVRRERMWNTFIPRNAVSIDISSNPDIQDVGILDKSRKFKERMRDNYLILNMKYDNNSGNKFYVPYVKILYRQSIR